MKRDRLCFNCLNGSHQADNCRSKNRCRQCQGKHHSSLCNSPIQRYSQGNPEPEKHPETPKNPETTSINAGFTTTVTDKPTTVLLKTAVANIYAESTNLQVRATVLFDEGAQRSFITENLVSKLGLNTKPETIKINAFGSQNAELQSLKNANLKLRTKYHGDIGINALVVPTITAPLKNFMEQSLLDLKHLQGLELAHPVSNTDVIEIQVLIGADFYWDFVGDRIIRGNGPTAVESKLGYLLSGPVTNHISPREATTMFIATNSNRDTEANVQSYWDLETIGIKDAQENQFNYMDHYRENCLKFKDGHYSARLPWKDDHSALPTNYALAEKRTRTMIQRLTPELRNTYNGTIEEQLSRSFIEPVPEDNIQEGHYLPHHPVRKDSSTTPIRVVYDASSKASSGTPSLNDCLLTGEPLLNDLFEILIRFRLHNVAISTDIEKAFLHVGLDEADRNYTKFLWLSDANEPDGELKTFRFKSVLFGAVCSPFILNATVKKHLDTYPSTVSNDLKQNIYVDNIVSACDTDKEVLDYYEQSNSLMNKCGFNLRSWSSNSQSVRAQADTDGISENKDTVNVLGIQWNTVDDTLTYPVDKQPSQKDDHVTTKRQVVQVISKLFDPLGFLAPVHVKAKIFVQELWKHKLEWDEPLSEDLLKQWQTIRDNLISAREEEK